MIFHEPKVTFVPIDLSIMTSGTSNAGVETCTGPLSPSNRCDYANTFWLDGNGGMYTPGS